MRSAGPLGQVAHAMCDVAVKRCFCCLFGMFWAMVTFCIWWFQDAETIFGRTRFME